MSFLYLYCVIVMLTFATEVFGSESDNQPKIMSKQGTLILQASLNRNISLRLEHGSSSLLINNVNVMQKLHENQSPSKANNGEDDILVLPTSKEFRDGFNALRSDIDRLSQLMSSFQNRSRHAWQRNQILRNLVRLGRLSGRLVALQMNLAIDECAVATNPCKNGGTCFDGYKDYHCECPEGWRGKTCQEDVDECYLWAGSDLGCQNNAICTNTPGGYKCTCPKGFTGTHCRLRTLICQQPSSAELCGHGICVPANNHQGYTCICDQGWTRNTTAGVNSSASLACEVDVDECETSTNPCHGACINLPGSFKCGPCPPGYTGNGMTCLDIDECVTNNGGCSLQPKVRCINTEGSHHCGRCPLGWVGDGHSCELAPSNSCDVENICYAQAKCELISNVVTCTCPHGMFGHGFGPKGCEPSPLADSCEKHICQNNGTCLTRGRGTSCICPDGYSGALCETADSCHPNPCENGGSCKTQSNQSFKCTCQRGSTGKRCEVVRSVCGTIQQKSQGELTYPTDGSTEYAPDERCAWIVRTDLKQILNLTFTSFDVEEDPGCTHDWLQIHDGSSLTSQLIGRFCGKDLPLGGNILSSQHTLFFWFRSNNATNRPGFHMTWHSQPHVCGDIQEVNFKDEGILRSPGYPGKMPAHRECQWELSAPFGYRFALRLFDVTMGSVANCGGDTFKIYDGDLLLKEYCKSTSSEHLTTSTNKLKLHFHTDQYGSDSSFQLHYEVESATPHCGGTFTQASGMIAVPVGEAGICLYLIQQPPNIQIRLEFENRHIFESENCNLNSLEIFDGKTDEDSRLAINCGGQSQAPLKSTSNSILIRYMNKLPSNNNEGTFKVKYTRVCEFVYSGSEPGIITTPNYPNGYTDEILCTYRIYGPVRYVVHANFTDIFLEETEPLANIGNNDATLVTNNGTIEHKTYLEIHLSEVTKRLYYKAAPMELFSELNKMVIVFHVGKNSPNAGFRLHYTFDFSSCGGVYTRESGSFSLFLETGCKFIFEAPEGQRVHLKFSYNTNSADALPSLIYGNVSDGSSFLLKNITAPKQEVDETFEFNVVTLLPSDKAVISRATYTFLNGSHACGGIFKTLYGTIKSPNWPSSYAADLECIWTITAPLGSKIELQVQNFTLEPDCAGDVLEIRNGQYSHSPLIGRYCYDRIPSRITSFGNSLYLKFTSDSSVQAKGFHLTWQQTQTGCGGKLTSYKGSIHTPHTNDMVSNENPEASIIVCDWLINVAQGSSIQVKVSSSSDSTKFCRSNRLQIYDGPTTMQPLMHFPCLADVKASQLQSSSSSNQILIIYKLDNYTLDGPEFVLDYETNCNMSLNNLQGIIESPNFPEPYPELLNCQWAINAGSNNKIQLEFSHFSLELPANEANECSYDYVEVLDKQDTNLLKTYRLCSQMPEPITTVGNHLILRFVTDYSNSKEGFRAEYLRLGCGEVLTRQSGYLKSPNYPYSADMECEWYIEVPAGRQIVFTLLEFQMDTDQLYCDMNEMTIKDAKNSPTTLLLQCLTLKSPYVVTSTTNHLYIYYKSKPSTNRKFFAARYSTKEATCGGEIRSHYTHIASPHYPHNSTQVQNCLWEVTVPDALSILVYFKDLTLASQGDCAKNSFNITEYKGAAFIKSQTICNSHDRLFLLRGNKITIQYQIQASQLGSRFSLILSHLCGGKIEDDSGIIGTAGQYCSWTFSVPEGSVISINILEWDCHCPTNTSCDHRGLGYLKDYNNTRFRSEEATFMCELPQTNLVFETSSLKLFTNHVSFKATYSTIQHSCGGTLRIGRGTLVSPNYPASYPSNVECTWIITATLGNLLELEFEELDMPKSEHCNEDFLELRTVSNRNLLGVFCGNQLPDDVLTSPDSFWIRFQSSEASTGKGFKLKWRYAHLNEITNRTFGTIVSPPNALLRAEEEPFAWRIIVDREKFVELHVEHYLEGLKLHDGFDETALPVQIASSPWRFVSSSNVIYLRTVPAKPGYFMLKWNVSDSKPIDANTTTSKCHVEKKVDSHGRIWIKSPNYPNGYEPNLACEWIYQPANPNEHVVCEIRHVNLEVSDGCSSDYLKVSTSTDMMHWHEVQRHCDVPKPTIIVIDFNDQHPPQSPYLLVHGTPALKLDFVSDERLNGKGFSASVYTKCGSNLTQPVGFIKIPKIMVDEECLWHITAKPGRRILLQLNFAPQTTLGQCDEYALIYDGLDEHAAYLGPGKICYPSNVTEYRLNSTTNYVTIKYQLKWSPMLLGRWNLTYREYSDCNEEYRLIPEASVINVTSPNYPNVPQPHTECEWRVMAPAGELIQIKFIERFDMNAKFCDKEFVELIDGATLLGRKLGKFCHRPDTLTTTQNLLYMRYLTETSEPRMGFKAEISILKCGGSYTSLSGSIMSPGYPQTGAYPSNSQCDYVISLPSQKKIRLIVRDIHLPFDAKLIKTQDYLEVLPVPDEESEQQSSAIYIYGNATKGTQFDLSVSKAVVRFHTFAKTMAYKGFALTYNHQSGSCSQNVEGTSGHLTMHLFGWVFYSPFCRWRITVPKGLRVSLEFLNMDEWTNSNEKWSPQFAIYNDHAMLSRITSFNARSYNQSSSILSSDNTMLVRVYAPGGLTTVKTLRARYHSDQFSNCPPNINKDDREGSVDIQEWRPEFSAVYYCRSKAVPNDGETLVFNISNFQTIHRNTSSQIYPPLSFEDEYLSMIYKENFTHKLVPLMHSSAWWKIYQTEDVRVHQLTMTYKRHSCGGQFVLDDDFFEAELPPITDLNYGPIVCIWSLVKPYASLHLHSAYHLSGNFTFSDGCEREFLMIKGNEWESSPVITLCRDSAETLDNYVIGHALTLIVYQSANYSSDLTQFSMGVQKAITCGSETSVTHTHSRVQIEKETYRNNMECVWIFNTVPGFYLQLSFKGRFFIETSPNCTNDYLEIQHEDNGLWIADARYCGRDIPPAYNSSTSRVQVVFRTNEAIRADGFSLLVRKHCFVVLNVGSEMQSIATPQIFGHGIRQFQCDYIFQSNNSQRLISVRAKNQMVSSYIRYDHCRYGFTVYKRNELGAELEGGKKHCEDEFEERSFKYLRLHFDSHILFSYTLEYGYDSCGGNITTSPANIRPLKHESLELYANNMNCIWQVTAPPDRSIAIRFEYFDTEAIYDHVSIYEGNAINADKLVKKLSGNLTTDSPPIVFVDNRQAVINSISDFSNSAKGFRATVLFITNCNERISLTHENSPVHLARSFKVQAGEEYVCFYRLSAPKGNRIRMNLKSLQINNDTASCARGPLDACNTLEILDSAALGQASMGKFRNATTGVTRVSAYADAIVKFAASQVGQFSFEIILTMEATDCGSNTEIQLGDTERFVLTNARSNNSATYSPHVHCIWKFKQDHSVQVHFNFVDLQNASQVTGKCLDYLLIKGHYNSYELCGRITNYTVTTDPITLETFEIIFHSDESIEGRGFEAIIGRADNCNRTYTALNGRISYNNKEWKSEQCNDTIAVPEKYNLNFYFELFSFLNFDCNKLHFRLSELKTNKTIYERCHNGYESVAVFTTTNAVRIEVSEFSLIPIFYTSSERNMTPGCGGTFPSTDGIIASPHYENDRNYSECRWIIMVPSPNVIKLRFDSFNMGPTTNCHLDNVKIFDIMPDGSEKLLKTLCGPDIPDGITSTSSQLAIISKKSPNFDGTDWSLTYKMSAA
ncbi:cubilin homolog [Stomoxys calcitrans]|uniref:cubilin homolog n=1 Tax=Stomoxys calcitrans TaxID=35570 RepID=UPI0027E28AB6|nr:cubilin homolog [Stomoxys calcitrans]